VPTYEYTCGSCDTKHDIVQKMTDPTLTECPSCGQPTLRKIFGGVGVVFKGSGFYRTDSRSGSEKSGSEKSGSEKSGSEKSGSEKSGSDKPSSKTSTSSAPSKSGSEKSGGAKKEASTTKAASGS